MGIEGDTQNLGDFPDILGTKIFDAGSQSLRIHYFVDANPERLADFLDRFDRIDHVGDVSLVLVPVHYSAEAINKVIAAIFDDLDGWAKTLSVEKIWAAGVDDSIGGINILATGTKEGQSGSVQGYPVSFTEGGNITADNRVVDAAPFKAGARLNREDGSSQFCTLGWTWKKWSTNEKMGGAAEHCYLATGDSTWWNVHSYVGIRYYYNDPVDLMLLRSSPKSAFQAKVFIGSPTTSYTANVVGAVGAPTVGATVALSAATSGGPWVGTVLAVYPLVVTDYGNIGPMAFTTVDQCMPGDSGGTWLTTEPGGGAYAHGSHFGEGLINGVPSCAYIPVVSQSAALSASILLAP